MKQDREAIKALMISKVLELCEQCLHYNAHLQIEGLLGLTFDHNDVVLVNINKILSNVLQRQQSQVIDLSTGTRSVNNNDFDQSSSTSPIRSDKRRYGNKSALGLNREVGLPSSTRPCLSSQTRVNATSIITINNDDDDYTNELGTSAMDTLLFPVDPLLGTSDVEYNITTGYEQEQAGLDLDERVGWNHRKGRKRKKQHKTMYPILGTMKIEQQMADKYDSRPDTSHEHEQYELNTAPREPGTEVKDEPLDMLHIKTDDFDNMSLISTKLEPVASVAHHEMVLLPPTQRKSKPAKRCRVCYSRGKRKESRYYCPLCPSQPGLCPRECFSQYHSNQFYRFNASTVQHARTQKLSGASNPLGINQDYLSLTFGSSIAESASCNTSPHSMLAADVPSTSLISTPRASYIDVVNAWHRNNENVEPVNHSPAPTRQSKEIICEQLPADGNNVFHAPEDDRPMKREQVVGVSGTGKSAEKSDISYIDVVNDWEPNSYPSNNSALKNPQDATKSQVPTEEVFNTPEEEQRNLERAKRKKSSSMAAADEKSAKPLLRRRSSARLRSLSSAGGQGII